MSGDDLEGSVFVFGADAKRVETAKAALLAYGYAVNQEGDVVGASWYEVFWYLAPRGGPMREEDALYLATAVAHERLVILSPMVEEALAFFPQGKSHVPHALITSFALDGEALDFFRQHRVDFTPGEDAP
jgi:hypothetical protein